MPNRFPYSVTGVNPTCIGETPLDDPIYCVLLCNSGSSCGTAKCYRHPILHDYNICLYGDEHQDGVISQNELTKPDHVKDEIKMAAAAT